jgi:hypothetical protein
MYDQRVLHSPFARLQISKARAELKRERKQRAAIAGRTGLAGSHLAAHETGLASRGHIG